jgi:uncharacterized protein with NAD-binding domain and iron-sulfur cluster
MTDPSAVVVGGGLAGIVVARELALRGWRVVILERSKRLGGKAGSDIKNGQLVEHGYHVFPQWYPNVRAILKRIQVRLIAITSCCLGSIRAASPCVGLRDLWRCCTTSSKACCRGTTTFFISITCWT